MVRGLISGKVNTSSNIYPTRCNVTQFILSGNCFTCFVWYHHPSSGGQTTVSTASGICHTFTTTCRYRGRVRTGLSVLTHTPDDAWRYHPKHVERFPDIINCVTSHLVGYILEYNLIIFHSRTRPKGDLISSQTLKHTKVFMYKTGYFDTILDKCGFI
jgi:hypothetical protein